MKSRPLRILLIACCAMLTACGGGGSSPVSSGTPTPAPPASPIAAGLALPPAGTIYFGVFPDASGLARGDSAANTQALEAQIGRKLALDETFLNFTRLFRTRLAIDDYQRGRLPIYSWECGPKNGAIIAGTYDNSILQEAKSVKNYGWPVFVRYNYDPNLSTNLLGRSGCYDKSTDNPDGTFSASQYVQAWDHVRAIFTQEGTVNAIWVWSVSNIGINTDSYYPGDSEVDWIGIDAFSEPGESFGDTFASTYALVAPHAKPIMITEAGAAAPDQTQFFTGGASTLQTSFPLVSGFVYYDAIGPTQDWRIAPASLPAFTTFAHDPYVSAFYAVP